MPITIQVASVLSEGWTPGEARTPPRYFDVRDATQLYTLYLHEQQYGLLVYVLFKTLSSYVSLKSL